LAPRLQAFDLQLQVVPAALNRFRILATLDRATQILDGCGSELPQFRSVCRISGRLNQRRRALRRSHR
jgi:hypothetical protein